MTQHLFNILQVSLVSWYDRSYNTRKTAVKSSPPINLHPLFLMPDALPVTQPTVSKHGREDNYSS